MQDKITKLTDIYYSIAGLDHHKDRDCHWYINTVYSYGEQPYYRLEHYGYLIDFKDEKRYKTYEEAQMKLYKFLKNLLTNIGRESLLITMECKKFFDEVQKINANKTIEILDKSKFKDI